jgi:hypothetical protein
MPVMNVFRSKKKKKKVLASLITALRRQRQADL